MIVRVRFARIHDDEKINVVDDWSCFLEKNVHCSFHALFDKIHSGASSCGRKLDLSWIEPDTCRVSIAITSKDMPLSSDLLPTGIHDCCLNDFHEIGKKIFLQYEAKAVKPIATSECIISVDEGTSTANIIPPKQTIIDILIKKCNHYPALKSNASLNTSKQYNAIVNYVIKRQYGVTAGSLVNYQEMVKHVSNLLWEVDPNYSKFKSRGKSLRSVVEKELLGFKNPRKYGHAAKPICATSLALKIQVIYRYLDRVYMEKPHMKPFKNILFSICENLSLYVTEMEEQNARTKKAHNVEENEVTVDDFVVTQVKLGASNCENLLPLRAAMESKNVYEPCVVNEFVNASNRMTFSRIIRILLQEGLPFTIKNYSIFHYKLPSNGPHKAVHFMWKQFSLDSLNSPEALKLVNELKSSAKTFYSRSMKHEVKQKILKLGVVKSYQAEFLIKDLLGDDSAANDENQREILARLNIAIESGDDIVVDLRKNNGKKRKFEDFWQVVADFIEEKSALDDRRHATFDENEVVVNIALATSQSDMYRECVLIAKEKNIENIPSLAWFLLQFWPTTRTASKMLHYTGRFKVRRMLQARLLRKQNVDLHYANAQCKYLKERSIEHSSNVAFFSADAKCKVSVGEPYFPIAAVTRGKQVIVGVNEIFKVGDHDFSKLSIIPDAYLIHSIPEKNESNNAEIGDDETTLVEGVESTVGNWYSRQVFYSFKNMVLQGSSAIRCAAEMGQIALKHYNNTPPPRWYAYTDGGPERKVDNLSVQLGYIAMFLNHDLDEFLVCRTAANQSYRNPVERCHATANRGLQSFGVMRKKMSSDWEKILKRVNTNDEIRKLCANNPELSTQLTESLNGPIDLMEEVFQRLQLKGQEFKIFQPSTTNEIDVYKNLLMSKFDDGIINLRLRANFTLRKFPKLHESYDKHCASRTYYFHVFKCEDEECMWHEPLKSGSIEAFRELVTVEKDGGVYFVKGDDPEENFLTSKMSDPTKRPHSIPFTPTAQTALNVGMVIKCSECRKPRVMYAKKKLANVEMQALKRVLNGFQYVCGTVFQEMEIDERNRDSLIIDKVFMRENIACYTNVEASYYSSKKFPTVGVQYGRSTALRPVDQIHYPQCTHCPGEAPKVRKRKTVAGEELRGGKQQKTIV